MRLVAGVGASMFLSFAVAATLLIFFQYHHGSLLVDRHGPYWGYGNVAGCCGLAALAWGALWLRVPALMRWSQTARLRPAAEKRPISIGLLTTGSL